MPSPSAVVSTTSGRVQGIVSADGKLHCYLGIPYAEPPVGALRFRPPVAKRPWSGIRDAVRFGNASMQIFDPHEGAISDFTDEPPATLQPFVGNEDCLTLNIWTPGADANKRPVFLWIHGGANHLESSRLPIYHGDRLATLGDIVVVTLNYRLGLFGFLDISVLGDPSYAGAVCNGLRDQALAIDWVYENIGAFGGDPDNITVAGESAGGMDISWLVASGRLRNRARRIVLMSNVKGPAGFGENSTGTRHSAEEGARIARQFLRRLGFTRTEDLIAAPADEIFKRLAQDLRADDVLFDLDSLFYPCADTAFAPVEPFRAVRGGALEGVDVLLGYTNYEAGLWLSWDDEMDQRPPEWMAERFGYLAADLRAEIGGHYRRWFPEAEIGRLGMHMMSDCGFAMPMTWFAEEASAAGSNTWLYRFDWQVNDRLGAMHAADLPFFFGRPNEASGRELIGEAKDSDDLAARERLSLEMSERLIAFIRHGDPNRARLTHMLPWPRYDAGNRAALIFDNHVDVCRDPNAERRIWWTEKVYLPRMR
jgi:para-nitrobenzyl esterase